METKNQEYTVPRQIQTTDRHCVVLGGGLTTMDQQCTILGGLTTMDQECT
jgi:NADPH-dependent glutamate synthase beta subunit-like oxidoreductase